MSPRNDERVSLGLLWRDWYLFKAHEWTRLFGDTPTAVDWNRSMARSTVSAARLRLIEARHSDHLWPSTSSISGEFGSWNAMMDAAGLPKLRPGGRKSERGPIDLDPELLDRIAELWSDDELWADGSGLDAVAERVGLSPGIVLSHTRRIEGLPERVLDPPKGPQNAKVVERRERVAELWRKGISATRIAAELGIARSTVYQDVACLRKQGIDLPKCPLGRPRQDASRKLSRDQLTIVKRLRAEGWSAHRISALLGLPERQVRQLAEVEDSRRAHLVRRRARIRVMRHAGMELSAIAERLGVAEQVVEQDLRVLDFGKARRKIPGGNLGPERPAS